MCADFVRQNARLADIGTDHAYLPLWLCLNGTCPSAVAADINPEPLARGQAAIKAFNAEKLVSARLSDGLENIAENEADDFVLAGMGGELIADILSRQNVTQKHIIINAMTHPEIARKFLYDNGFEIDKDLIVKDGRRYYSVFDAYYTGEIMPKSRVDYYLGNIKDFSNKGYFSHLLNYLKNKEKSGKDLSDIINAVEAAYDNS